MSLEEIKAYAESLLVQAEKYESTLAKKEQIEQSIDKAMTKGSGAAVKKLKDELTKTENQLAEIRKEIFELLKNIKKFVNEEKNALYY